MLCCSYTVLAARREVAAHGLFVTRMQVQGMSKYCWRPAQMFAPAKSTSATGLARCSQVCTGPEHMAAHRSRQTSTPLLAACREAVHTASSKNPT